MKNTLEPQQHEWPEEEPSVSFTIYEANPSSETNQNGNRRTVASHDSWSSKHVIACIILLLISVTMVMFFSFFMPSTEFRMPDYDRIVARQEQQEQKRLQQQEAKKRETQRIEEEIRRKQQEELDAIAAQEALSAEEDLEDELLEDVDVEELLQELFE